MVNMRFMTRVEDSPQSPADEDVSESLGRFSINQPGARSRPGGGQDQTDQPRLATEDWELQQPGGHLALDFQDSNLSPALSLFRVNSGVEHNFTEYSLFHQSDNEFVPLRAYPDISMASDRFHFQPQDRTTRASECGSLSQHPLAHESILSEDGAISCFSPPQQSLPPGDEGKQEEMVHSRLTANADKQGVKSRDDGGGSSSREKDPETLTDPLHKLVGEEDEAFFLSKDIPAQYLLQLLKKDVGMPSSSSSAVSSASQPSVRSNASLVQESKSTGVHRSTARREAPPGEASLPQQQTQQQPDRSQTHLSSEVCNITTGSRSTRPDDSSEELHRELLSEAERHSSREAQPINQQQKCPSPPGQRFTPYPAETSQSTQNVIRTNLGDLSQMGPLSAGVERVRREQDLWSSGNQTGIDGSYLGFLPQSQSTPGVFKAPPRSSVKATLGKLSAIESDKENSYQSRAGISALPPAPEPDVHRPDINQRQEEHTSSAKVQSLPSLTYMEKVDAWRANQSSGKTPLFDSLALQGFSGISPKQKAYDAVSETLNRILTEQVRSLQQPPVLSAVSHDVSQSSSAAPSGSSSPRRGEAAGSSPSDKDNTRSAAIPLTSPFCRSQSHSSLSTVVMSVQKEKVKSHTQDDDHHRLSASAQPSPLADLGQFSDVSVERDLTLSSSQESYNSGIKVGTSIGASSVTSLEVDNYAPYWTSKLPSTPPPPGPRELNIEERIPLYLHNLGINQSPSTILTPFAPRGPIREPEFSPTDLSTIKGSIGTPTKSEQPSEGGSPHKGEFSRSSVLSVDSSVSIPFSLDSLGPVASVPERSRRASPPTDAEVIHSKASLPYEDSQSSTVQPSLQQQEDSSLSSGQSALQLGERFDLESPLQTNRSLAKSGEDFLVSSKALWEIRSLLSQAETVASGGSSATSLAAPRLLSDNDLFHSSRKKTSKLHDSTFSSSATEDPRTRSSLLSTRSSSDSMLTSEKPRQISVGGEGMSSLWQPDHPSTQFQTTAPAAGSTLDVSKSARRAEPEGCSAAPPDNIAPIRPAVVKSPPQHITSTLTEMLGSPEEEEEEEEEEEKTALGDSAQSMSSSSPALEDTDQGAVSDGSSQSSLAVRVAKLLQSEESATAMVSSTPSTTDQEEGRAREWIKLKISGQQCETLELDKEDRRRIEEIKRELLLKYPMKGQLSSDTESSTGSSVGVPRGQDPPHPAPSEANNQLSQPPRELGPDVPDSGEQRQSPRRPETLEAQVRKIAAREGVTLPRTNPQALTSISIATRRRTTSPSPSSSPAPPVSPAPEPLHLTELCTVAVEHQKANMPPAQNQDEAMFEPHGGLYAGKQSLNSPLTSGNQRRRDAVGGHFEEPPPPSQGLNREDEKIKDDDTQSFRRDNELFIQNISASGAHGAETPTEFVPLRTHCSSPDEGVGLSSPPEWNIDTREPRRQQRVKRADASDLFRSGVPKGRVASFTPHHRAETSKGTLTGEPPAPVLLPYKPHGSEELFYVPQLEADVSSTGPSDDTTMESSHTGSDDAVPPRFGSEVLGRQDPGLDRGVTIRHVEGIYSKRLKTAATFKMQEPGRRDVSRTPKPEASRRDQGTSPMQFQPVHKGRNCNESGHHLDRSSAPRPGDDVQQRSEPDVPHPISLDQLWQRFCDRWTVEDSRPTRDGEASLLERLERLSRLIHSTRGAIGLEGRREETRRGVGEEAVGGSRKTRQQTSEPTEEKSHSSFTSSVSHASSQSLQLGPAGRDESATSSAASTSVSTVDTARLVRVFGAHRVQHLKSSSSLGRLHDTIHRQKEGREQRRGRQAETETTGTDESSVVADSTSSTSTYTVPSHRGASTSPTAKRNVKLVSKGIQTARAPRQILSSSSSVERGRGGGGERGLTKVQSSHKQRKSKRSPAKPHAKAERVRGENRYDRDKSTKTGADGRASYVTRNRIQIPEPKLRPLEALEMRLPHFICRSRQRVKCLALQAEERRLQAVVFTRGRDELLDQRAGRLLHPAGAGQLRRAVPRKEMIQRSKQIYENLPEVKRRREEDRRRAEYRSYRLNAQIYNKRITNRVLGRRPAWQ
ncbi:putative Alstrom syndrome protein 1 [Scophthalmus maximus]|uniref:Putative Alstrom syndrome protein 1 n=1 Tax=Scophthalmus maximus TaxID=52904 RepID=A0A2U9CII5_SCOMX|nr:putative Alstrom syndrome protein 1 [Scophthalmus maximus]